MSVFIKIRSLTSSSFKIASLFFLFSCSKDHFDAGKAAETYCECLKENGSPEHFIYATRICDAELIKSNRYYRIAEIDLASLYLRDKISEETVDSTREFLLEFMVKRREICCKQVLMCSEDSISN